MDDFKHIAEKAVHTAKKHGAETVEVAVTESVEFEVLVRKSKIENLTEATSRRIDITVSVDKKRASVTSSDLSEESIEELIVSALEICSIMDRDEYYALPDEDELGTADGDLEMFDEETTRIATAEKIRLATEIEDTALSLDSRIISDGGFFSNSTQRIVIANSLGFCDGYKKTSNSLGVSCAVDEAEGSGENTAKKQSSYWYSAAVSFKWLEPAEEVAREAVKRTLRKLGARKPKTQKIPIVFDNTTASSFLAHIASAVNGGNIYRRESFLVDKIGSEVASSNITIIDDPLLKGRLGSRPFDSEGVRSRVNTVIEKGILKTYLMNSYQARKLGKKTTGNAGEHSNLYIKPGSYTQSDIIASIDSGLLLTFLSGPGANTTTGDFSQGAQGIWIEKGELTYPVDEFTIASTFQEMLEGITMVGDDIDWRRTISSPTIKIDQITISGL